MKNEILGEMGRLLFIFSTLFGVRLSHKACQQLAASGLDKYGRLACSLEHVSLTESFPPKPRR